MFYFRINKIKVVNNYVHTLFQKRDKADVQLISFITTGDNPLPNLHNFNSLNEADKDNAVIEGVKIVASSRIFTNIENIKDGQTITFGDTGIVLYQTNKIPNDFNWNLVVVGSKERLRQTANMITDVLNDESFNDFKLNLKILLSVASNPAVTGAIEISNYIAKLILKIYANKKDDQLGIVFQSWNRAEHYPHGLREKIAQVDASGNMFYDYSMFGFDDGAVADNAIR